MYWLSWTLKYDPLPEEIHVLLIFKNNNSSCNCGTEGEITKTELFHNLRNYFFIKE
jgi:hypothetical protein